MHPDLRDCPFLKPSRRRWWIVGIASFAAAAALAVWITLGFTAFAPGGRLVFDLDTWDIVTLERFSWWPTSLYTEYETRRRRNPLVEHLLAEGYIRSRPSRGRFVPAGVRGPRLRIFPLGEAIGCHWDMHLARTQEDPATYGPFWEALDRAFACEACAPAAIELLIEWDDDWRLRSEEETARLVRELGSQGCH